MTDWTRIQGITDATAANTSVSFASTVSNGSIVVGGALFDPGLYMVSVTDDKGNLYDITAATGDTNWYTAGFKSRGLITNAPQTITITLSGTASGGFWKVIEEFSSPTGCSHISLDGTTCFTTYTSSSTQGLNGLVSSPFQTLHSDVLIWGWSVFSGSISVGAGFSAGVSSGIIISEWMIQSTPSTSNQLVWGTQTGDIWGCCFGVAPVAATSWVPVQRRGFQPGSSATSFSLSLPNKMAPGNVFVGGLGLAGGNISQLVSLKDDLGTDYTPQIQSPNTGGHAVFWSGGFIAGAPQTLTLTLSVSQAAAMTVTEFAPPPGAISVSDEGSALNTTIVSSTLGTVGPITTTKNGDLIFSWLSDAGLGGCNPLGGINALNFWGISNSDGYFIQSAAGAISQQWQFSSSAPNLIEYALAIGFNLPAQNLVLMEQRLIQ